MLLIPRRSGGAWRPGSLSRRPLEAFHRSISSSIKSPTPWEVSVPRASFTSGTRHHKSRGSSSRRSVPTEGGLGHAPLGRWRRRRPAPRVELAKACCRVFVHLQEGVPPSYARLSRRPSGRPSGRAASTRPSATPAFWDVPFHVPFHAGRRLPVCNEFTPETGRDDGHTEPLATMWSRRAEDGHGAPHVV